MKALLKQCLPRPVYNLLRIVALRSDHPLDDFQDVLTCLSFLRDGAPLSLREKSDLLERMYSVSEGGVPNNHTHTEILSYMSAILTLPQTVKGIVVEAGCYKGSSTAKFSLAADIAGRELVVFDSFQGIPENDEPDHHNIFGGMAHFEKGDYCGSIEEVRANVARLGKIDICRFIPGWFEDTMPRFNQPIAAAYLDCDLASSTRTCLKYLYPLLQPGGVLYSQDGHIPLVIKVFEDESFWRNEVKCERPYVEGLGKKKLIRIVKNQ